MRGFFIRRPTASRAWPMRSVSCAILGATLLVAFGGEARAQFGDDVSSKIEKLFREGVDLFEM
ncbi:MAG: hypothetical protein ACYS9X_20590, partial [Planctomycetota bacterium]